MSLSRLSDFDPVRTTSPSSAEEIALTYAPYISAAQSLSQRLNIAL